MQISRVQTYARFFYTQNAFTTKNFLLEIKRPKFLEPIPDSIASSQIRLFLYRMLLAPKVFLHRILTGPFLSSIRFFSIDLIGLKINTAESLGVSKLDVAETNQRPHSIWDEFYYNTMLSQRNRPSRSKGFFVHQKLIILNWSASTQIE